MTVSVIVPVLNEAEIIESALKQVTSLQGNFEIIVVDGGSSDQTVSLARRFAVVLSSPKGRAAQMNAGAKAAKGDILLFLHADTSLPGNALPAVEKALKDPEIAGGRFKIKLDETGWEYRMVETGINVRDYLIKGFTGDQVIFVRKSVFESLGGYLNMPLMEDLDFGRRLCRAGRVIRLPLTVVTSARRWKKKGLFRTILLMWALRIGYLMGKQPHRLYRFYGDTR